MTHLSDYSYLQRLVANIVFFLLIQYYILLGHHKGCKDWKAFKESNFSNPRILAYLFFTVAYIAVILYDILAAQMKYAEGFEDVCLVTQGADPCGWYRLPGCENGIRTKSVDRYSGYYKGLLPFINTLWNIACTFRNSSIFLYLAWFNSSVKDFFPLPVMRRWEVWVYFVYSIASVAMYFLLPVIFNVTPLISTISTQIFWSIELIGAAVGLCMTNVRIGRMRRNDMSSKDTERILGYIKTMNYLLFVVVIGESISLLIINLDILTGELILNKKLLTDLFTNLVNFFYIFETPVLTLLLYPPSFISNSTYEDTTVPKAMELRHIRVMDIT